MPPTGPIAYEFTASKIVFGWGCRGEAGRMARPLGRRGWIVCGAAALAENGALDGLEASLVAEGIAVRRLGTWTCEPEVAHVDRLATELDGAACGPGDFVVGLGGGAAIDLAKAVAAMAVNRQSDTVGDYLENVGRDLPLTVDPLPVMALPTTAGTGAEATRNAVISSYDPPFKKSLRSEKILPRVAIVDPELTTSVPAAVTAASGMDAITQLIESFVSRKARPIPQALALEGLRHALPAIVEAVSDGGSRPAREQMAHAALLSGMALANSGLGMAHGVAAALGVHARVPHGLACAVLLPVALKANRGVREAEMAQIAWATLPGANLSSRAAAADRLVDEIASLCERVGVPRRLSALGVAREQLPALVRDSRGSSMSGNPRDLSDAELSDLLEEIL